MLSILPSNLSDSVTGVWIYQDKGLAVIQSEKAHHFVEKSFTSKDSNQVCLHLFIIFRFKIIYFMVKPVIIEMVIAYFAHLGYKNAVIFFLVYTFIKMYIK